MSTETEQHCQQAAYAAAKGGWAVADCPALATHTVIVPAQSVNGNRWVMCESHALRVRLFEAGAKMVATTRC